MYPYIRSNIENEGLVMKTRCSTQHLGTAEVSVITTMGLAIVISRSFSSSYGANPRHRVAHTPQTPVSKTQSSKFNIAEASLPSARPNSDSGLRSLRVLKDQDVQSLPTPSSYFRSDNANARVSLPRVDR